LTLGLLLQAAITWTLVGGGTLSPTGFYRAPTNSGGPALVIARCPDCRVKSADTAIVTMSSGGGTLPGVPFGLSATPVANLGGLVSYTLLPAHKGVLRDLAEIKARGARVSVNLTGGGACALDASGTFRYDLWRACFDLEALPNHARITAYGDSGTVSDIYLIDEPNHQTRWGPEGSVPQATVEQMACYAKSLFPRIPTAVRASPEWLAQRPVTYRCLDGAWAQYRANRGRIQDYVRIHKDGAVALGLWVGFAINVIDGGTTDPADPLFSGWRSGTSANGSPLYSMSPAEILAYGVPMVGAKPCALSGFRFDESYLAKPGVRVALDSLARLASQQPRDCS
jgi:hypothetical protein